MPTTGMDLLKPGDIAVVVFTRGLHLNCDGSPGKGASGKSRVNPQLLNKVDIVIMYMQDTYINENHIKFGDICAS